MNEIGVAGWALNRAILKDKSLTMLEFPALARDEFGVETIELVSGLFENQSAKYLNAVRLAAEKARVRVAAIAVDTGTLTGSDSAERRTDLEAIKQWFHVARAIGAAAIRVNTGHAAADDPGAIERVIEGYRELTAHGQACGVRTLIENHGGLSADVENLKRILLATDAHWFGSAPDVNNFAGDTWEAGMRVMAPRAFVVHVKSWNYDPNGVQITKRNDGSTGRYDLKECLRILKASGYQGPLNYEYNHAETDERVGVKKGIAYTRELLATL